VATTEVLRLAFSPGLADLIATAGLATDDPYEGSGPAPAGVLAWSQHMSGSHRLADSGNAYIDPSSGALQLTPRSSHPANVQLVAHCLIWAQRALDRLIPDPSRAQGLKNLASAIQAIPVLPDYQPPAHPRADAPGGRRSRRRRASRLASETES
jgi:hypothetical protein